MRRPRHVIVDQMTWINGEALLEAASTSIRINGVMLFRCALM